MRKKRNGIIFLMSVLVMLLGVLYWVKSDPKDVITHKPPSEVSPIPEDEEEEVPVERIETITLMAVGDFLYHRPQTLKVPSEASGYDYYNNLQYVKPYLEKADITFGNYESTSTPTREYMGYPTFNTPPESIDALKDAGFDILNTVNNHTLDSGKQGLIDTYNNIISRDIKVVGTKVIPSESVQVIIRNDIRVGFLGYTYGYNGLESRLNEKEHLYMGSLIEEERMEREIAYSKKTNDFTIVSMHWGNEYQIAPNDYQKKLAQKLAEWGVDVILGTHPHVIQPSQVIGDTYVIYSMGNFISDQRLETLDKIETERGVMLEIELTKNFTYNESKVGKVTPHPTWVNKYQKEGRSYYEVIPTKDYLDGTITPYTPNGSKERIQSAHDAVYNRITNSITE